MKQARVILYVYKIFFSFLLSFDSVVASFACLQSHFQPMFKKYRLSAVNTKLFRMKLHTISVMDIRVFSGFFAFFWNHPFCHPWHLSYSFLLFDDVPATMSFKQIWKKNPETILDLFEKNKYYHDYYLWLCDGFCHCFHHGVMVFGASSLVHVSSHLTILSRYYHFSKE